MPRRDVHACGEEARRTPKDAHVGGLGGDGAADVEQAR